MYAYVPNILTVTRVNLTTITRHYKHWSILGYKKVTHSPLSSSEMMEDYNCYSVMPSGSLVAEHTTLNN